MVQAASRRVYLSTSGSQLRLEWQFDPPLSIHEKVSPYAAASSLLRWDGRNFPFLGSVGLLVTRTP